MGPSKVSGAVAASEGRFRPSWRLHEVGSPSREVAELRSRYSVPGTRLAVSTTARFSEDPLPDAEASGSLSWASTPLRGSPRRPRRSPARLRLPSWGFAPLQRHESGGPLFPGFQPRFVPPPGFLTLLTGCSLRTSRSRGPVPLMGFTLQSVSPPQSRSPFGAVALLLFLTSRHPALRTRRSRCPAAPGPCSLRRSVPARGRNPGWADALMGFAASPERFLARRGDGFPPPSLMPFRPSDSGRPTARSSRASPNARVDRISRACQLS
jgi:hypothetical protein